MAAPLRNRTQGAQQNERKPWLKPCWCIPPQASAAFVWRMEDVLSAYTRPYNLRSPQLCMDESAKQLLQDKRESLPGQQGQPERVEYTFEAAGMCKLFLACEPLAGRRQVKVTERRTSQDSCSLHPRIG
jgi:hypothetical protein